jgi:hypothetical protein
MTLNRGASIEKPGTKTPEVGDQIIKFVKVSGNRSLFHLAELKNVLISIVFHTNTYIQ